MSQDLWPDFEPQKIITPKTILTEQASALTSKTKNIIAGEIVQGASNKPNMIVLFFRIVAPALKNYKYNLFTLTHEVFLYPCTVIWNGKNHVANTHEELYAILKNIFNDDSTKKVINSLYSQSVAE